MVRKADTQGAMQRLKPILHPPGLLRVRRGGSDRLEELLEVTQPKKW